MKKLKRKSPPSKAMKKAAEEQAKAEKIYEARMKFERLISRCHHVNTDWGYFKLVSEPGEDGEDGEEGEFEPEELALVPAEQLGQCLLYLEETEGVLETMRREISEAYDARLE
jgi:hypothetical protein